MTNPTQILEPNPFQNGEIPTASKSQNLPRTNRPCQTQDQQSGIAHGFSALKGISPINSPHHSYPSLLLPPFLLHPPNLPNTAMPTLLPLSTTKILTISEALFFFLMAAFITIGLCSTAAQRRKREFAEAEEKIKLPAPARFQKEEQGEKWTVSDVMARLLCWSGRNERLELDEGGVGWRDVEAESGNSVAMSPLWQRRILMGERCQMPMFSGVILYDERGRLLRGNSAKAKQETPVAPVTTLKDLL